MRAIVLPVHPTLANSSRLPVLTREGDQLYGAEVLLLLLVGVGATLTTAASDFGLRIPGHAIIRAVFPMAFGLALAPRRMAGMVMGAGAVASAVALRMKGVGGLGAGAMTSLALTGPLLDVALWRAGRGWRLYVGFALAGLGANLAALAVRAGAKLVGIGHAGGRPFAAWWPQAIATYALCGVLAGLFSAWVWFQLRDRGKDGVSSEAAG